MTETEPTKKASTSWVKFGGEGHAENFCFLRKDTLVVGQNSYVLFLKIKHNPGEKANYSIYEAHGMDNHADGVSCIAAHGVVPVFAIAEKKLNAQIYVLSYPLFAPVSKLKCTTTVGYQALAFSEGEIMVSLSQHPQFALTIWNWICGENLKSINTGTLTLNQQLKCVSNSPILISQSSDETNELKIWEASICYSTVHVVSKCVNMPDAIHSSVCWMPEGILWFINDRGDIYSVDPQSYVPKLFHCGESSFCLENLKPSIVFCKTSLIVSTPEGQLKAFSKKQKGVLLESPHMYEIKTPVSKIAVASDLNTLVGWTVKGELVKTTLPEPSEEGKCVEFIEIFNFGEAIFDISIVNPEQEYFVTISRRSVLQIWKNETGELTSELCFPNGSSSLAGHPSLPIVAVGGNNGAIYFINLSVVTSPSTLCLHLLDNFKVTDVAFNWTGSYVVAACLQSGTFFLLQTFPDAEDFYQVTNCLTVGKEVASFSIIGSSSQPSLALLLPPPKHHYTSEATDWKDCILDIEIDDSGHYVIHEIDENCQEIICDETGKMRLPKQELLIYDINKAMNNRENDVGEEEEDNGGFILNAPLKMPLIFKDSGLKPSSVLSSFYYCCLCSFWMPFMKDSEIFAIPMHSSKMHILDTKTQGPNEDNEAKMIKILETGHQVRCAGNTAETVQLGPMQINDHYMLSFGTDGLIFLQPQEYYEKNEESIIFKAHHYFDAGVRKAVCIRTGSFVISLGWDGSLVGTKIVLANQMDTPMLPQEQLELSNYQLEMIQRLKSINPKEVTEYLKTWGELKAEGEVEKEMIASANEKSRILEDFEQLKAELNELMGENDQRLEKDKLPLETFELDQEWRNERIKKGENERQEEDLTLQNTIKEYDNKVEILQQQCWEPMAVKGKCIKAILGELEVENYPLLPDKPDFEDKVGQAIERRTMEIELTFNQRFTPWIPRSDSYNEKLLHQGINKPLSKTSVHQDERTRLYMAMMSTDDEDLEEAEIGDEEKASTAQSDSNVEIFEWSGSISHKFVSIPQCLHSQQLELYALNSLYNETILLEFIVDKLRKYFNAEFEKTMETKRQVMKKATGRIARLKEIQSEHQWCLNALNVGDNMLWFSLPSSNQKTSLLQTPLVSVTTVFEPRWDPREIPETGIMSVDDCEVDAIPYITPEEEAILAEKLCEEERLRKLREADNFRELALIEMMDGVLEVRWEDVIKKEVPKPPFMDNKDPADWTEAEIKSAKEYETKVKFLQSERDRYRKLLEHEFETRNEDLMRELARFDKSLQELHKLKLHVEACIIQENMKMNGMQLRNDKLNSLRNKEKLLMKGISDVITEAKNTELELQELHQALRCCTDIYESIMQKDKHLDQSFRKEGGEYSSSVSEQRYKLFKRRPKAYPRSALSLVLVTEIWKLHGCKSESWKEIRKSPALQKKTDHAPAYGDLLLPEAVEFLQTLDTMDRFSNAFPGIDEDGWLTLCKLRRGKLQNEIKAKLTAHELVESDNACKQCQKKLNSLNAKTDKLKEELNNIRISKLEICHNAQVQLIMKNGNVEIDLTGSLSDFSDAILIHRSVIENINEGIMKTGDVKLKAMKNFADFRRKVLLQEWEHKKMKMEIQDLVDQINLVEKTKVTKDVLTLLATMDIPEKSPKAVDRDVTMAKEVYGKKLKDVQEKINELDTRIEIKERENRKLDNAIRSINVDVNEQLLQCDTQLEHKYTKAINARMSALVRRSRLVNEIQQQHNDILVLQTELELLRLKTFPTFKYIELA